MKRILSIFLVVLISLGLIVGCSKNNESNTKNNNNSENKNETTEKVKLTIGVMPAVDTAPIFIAQQKGYFDEVGLDVDVQIYRNANDRQSALQSGQLDGTMTDIIALINNVEGGFEIKATTLTDGTFPILVSPKFDENSKSAKVGLMEVSVTNYLADEFLGSKYDMEKIFITPIPDRMEMLKSGQLDMSVFPEPIATNGELQGLKKLTFEAKNTPDVMVFTGKAMSDKSDAIKGFHDAFNKAVKDINKDENIAREILVEKLELDSAVKDKMTLPKYNEARVPSKEFVDEVSEWVKNVTKKDVTVTYDQIIEDKYVK